MLLDDTQPEESKTLIDEKLPKMTTERAPVAGQGPRPSAGRPGTPGAPSGRSLLDGLVDPTRGGSTGNPMVDQLFRGAAGGPSPFGGLRDMPSTPGGDAPGSGAAAAAGVLTAVDEDNEGDEEAKLPGDFEYFSDGGSEDDDEE